MNRDKLSEALQLINKAQGIIKVEWEKQTNASINNDGIVVLEEILSNVSDARGLLDDLIKG